MTATRTRWINPEAEVYRPEEVAQLFRVDTRTVGRWETEGKLPEGTVFRTPGGHRRFHGATIRALLAGGAR